MGGTGGIYLISILREPTKFAGLQSPISALSLGTQNCDFALGALRYHRVVAMTGAHVVPTLAFSRPLCFLDFLVFSPPFFSSCPSGTSTKKKYQQMRIEGSLELLCRPWRHLR